MEKELRELREALKQFAPEGDGDWCACIDITEGSEDLAKLYAALATRTEASRAPAEPHHAENCRSNVGMGTLPCNCGAESAPLVTDNAGEGAIDNRVLSNPLLADQLSAEERALEYITKYVRDEIVLEVDTLAAAIREAERVARIDLLKEMASSECRACKDNSNLIIDEESGEWAHERGEGLPNYLCQAPDVVAEKLAALGAEKEGEK